MIAFDAVGSAVKDVETWHLEDEDAEVLSDRLHSWLRSLDSKKAAAWEKKMAKYQPMLMLIFTLLILLVPRISATMDNKRNRNAGNIPPKGSEHFRAAGPKLYREPEPQPAPAAASYSGNPFEPGIKPVETTPRGSGGPLDVPASVTGRPAPVVATRLSRDELRSLDPEDVA